MLSSSLSQVRDGQDIKIRETIRADISFKKGLSIMEQAQADTKCQ